MEEQDSNDIFHENKIKLMTYVNYVNIERYSFVRRSGDNYFYLDKYTDKEVVFSYRRPTLNDYAGYLILVY
ncbi:hypothetical protein [Alphabaculovirus myunipunctae]|uniref:Uncharacterized protein n=1 Tax=Mythimna unipuncta nucleopolyhedrovirus TaxID=447897 RepID=A0A2K9VSD4_9ABAC|nr:hypothetical protein [Mythimna unipuncta nucleopolyhedrovirus]AUV65381.1 hypothetical protein [Mythimna unipuncta nucleopolyhedrovirus]